MRRFTLCIFVEDLPSEGYEFDSRHWPLHLTIIGNYFISDSQHLIDSIDSVANFTNTFSVTVGGDDNLGSNKDILVSRIVPSENLYTLHNSIVESLEATGVEFSNLNFIRDGYKPHITVQTNARKNAGDVVLVRHLSLVELEKDGTRHQRTVIKNFELQNGEL